jgi:hypothetical protein
MQIHELAQIQSGYTVRSPLVSDEAGVLVAQVRDLAFDGSGGARELQRCLIDGAIERYLIRTGDVLFRSRGERTTAIAIGADFSEPAVALLPIIILRPNPSRILPNFLAWAINQPSAQQKLDADAQGTNLRMVPKSSLEALDIDVPPIKTQAKIMQTYNLIEQELILSRKLATLRRDLHAYIIGQAASQLAAFNPISRNIEASQS